MSKLRTIAPSSPDQKPISFHPGGLHESLDVPMGKKIPAVRRRGALAGKYGNKAKKQANFAKNVLTGGQ